MHKSVQNTDRTIAVLSPDFLQSTFTAPEWAAAFATDPMGVARKLVPVRVRPCQIDGLLGQVVRIDLVGRDVIDAQKELLSGLELGRAKPLVAPAFPGPAGPTAPAGSRAPSPPVGQSHSGRPHWHVLRAPLEAQWQLVGDRFSHSGTTALEVQLVPTEPQRIEIRKLAALKDELAQLARSSGLIPTALAADTTASDQLAIARSDRSKYDVNTGLVVLRNGQRGAGSICPATRWEQSSIQTTFPAGSHASQTAYRNPGSSRYALWRRGRSLTDHNAHHWQYRRRWTAHQRRAHFHTPRETPSSFSPTMH